LAHTQPVFNRSRVGSCGVPRAESRAARMELPASKTNGTMLFCHAYPMTRLQLLGLAHRRCTALSAWQTSLAAVWCTKQPAMVASLTNPAGGGSCSHLRRARAGRVERLRVHTHARAVAMVRRRRAGGVRYVWNFVFPAESSSIFGVSASVPADRHANDHTRLTSITLLAKGGTIQSR
jgi:hypothetical protein